MIIFLPAFIFSGENNYLFENKDICMQCINEIKKKNNSSNGIFYTCKGRYGDKPGNKYFIMMNIESIINEKSDLRIQNSSTKKHYSSKQELIIKKQRGMDEDSIKKLCPDTYHKCKK